MMEIGEYAELMGFFGFMGFASGLLVTLGPAALVAAFRAMKSVMRG